MGLGQGHMPDTAIKFTTHERIISTWGKNKEITSFVHIKTQISLKCQQTYTSMQEF
jgi:hypothetical protein